MGRALNSVVKTCARYDEDLRLGGALKLEAGKICLAWQANNDDAGRMVS
jgi:hypothetical protein